ncbi:hypothetical protein ACW7G0_12260 [Lysobacter sp. A286]
MNVPSNNSSTNANRFFDRQHHNDIGQPRRTGAERDFGIGYGNRGYARNPDYLRTPRYAGNPGSHLFRIG